MIKFILIFCCIHWTNSPIIINELLNTGLKEIFDGLSKCSSPTGKGCSSNNFPINDAQVKVIEASSEIQAPPDTPDTIEEKEYIITQIKELSIGELIVEFLDMLLKISDIQTTYQELQYILQVSQEINLNQFKEEINQKLDDIIKKIEDSNSKLKKDYDIENVEETLENEIKTFIQNIRDNINNNAVKEIFTEKHKEIKEKLINKLIEYFNSAEKNVLEDKEDELLMKQADKFLKLPLPNVEKHVLKDKEGELLLQILLQEEIERSNLIEAEKRSRITNLIEAEKLSRKIKLLQEKIKQSKLIEEKKLSREILENQIKLEEMLQRFKLIKAEQQFRNDILEKLKESPTSPQSPSPQSPFPQSPSPTAQASSPITIPYPATTTNNQKQNPIKYQAAALNKNKEGGNYKLILLSGVTLIGIATIIYSLLQQPATDQK